MAYTTQDKLIARYGESLLVELTDRAEVPTGLIDAATVTDAIGGAAALIDGHLQGRYTLPLSETPPLIEEVAEAIAIYRLHRYSPEEKIKDEYKDALSTLGKISDGKIRLPIQGVEPATKPGNGVRVTDRERPLTAANMKGLI
ncbi:DUF1320 domain-containing protein [Phaeobacter sp. PT47_59]|uniref:gp436 family protein n=1 Tax=Phaeobacter sp. PT47_59 TaxID=3029979 RepID=UPI0023809652|nr:DUF1320 domain-containing protein [Phaeobacter sp. PT47_59]MDE4175798.1 DUF1320 domain-containing protein [Phaeobacter sp. PT47_59]